jgi:chlorobactene glucosyltransferase
MSTSHDWRRNAALAFVSLPLSIWAERTYQAMPRLDGAAPAGPLPSLSIIIPARDEARNLSRLLPSLQQLRYPGPVELIVVDDGSMDRTGQIAAAHGARVVRIDHLPTGWKGKPHACHLGAQAATGDWLLFTDADTLHLPGSAARAVAYALQGQLDGLSLFLKQESKSWLDRMALTAAYAGLFAGTRPQDRLLNGQYVLLQRDVYWESGGFEAVRADALEDVALGNRLRQQGYRVPILVGEDAATVRMYDNTRQLWNGMNRLGADSLRWGGLRAAWTAIFVTALMSPLVALLGVFTGKLDLRWLPATWAAAAVPMTPWASRFGNPLWAAAIPFGALFVQAAALWGILNRLVGRGIRWKGRRV